MHRSNPLEQGIGEGENPVPRCVTAARCVLVESGCLGLQLEVGGKFHLKLNTGERPIANKYREGKMKRTLKRELKVLEIVGREAVEGSGCSPVLALASVRASMRGAGQRGFVPGQLDSGWTEE